MRSIADETCHRLLAQMGVLPEEIAGKIAIAGADPVVASPHHLGAAAAAALAAQGAAVAAIWKMRTGRGQDVSVDLRRAVVPGLRTVFHVSQNGKRLRSRDAYGGRHFFRTSDNRQIYLLRASIYVKMLVGLLDLLKCASDDGSVAEAVAQWHSAELEDAIAERGLVGVIARRREEWRDHPQGQWLAGRPAIAMEKIGPAAPEKFGSAPPRPLSGVRVLDMTHVLAGPASARTLAEQGADVLHVISPRHVDTADKMIDTSFGKRSAFLDLDQEADRATLAELVRGCDVFVQSWRQGALAKHGFGPRDLAQLRPGIVTVSVSAYGAGGPWATRGGYDPVGAVTSGLAVEEGSFDAPALAPTGTLNDYLTAYLAAAGALGGLLRRAREGGSYAVDVSLTRSSMLVLELGLLDARPKPEQIFGLEPLPSDLRTVKTALGDITYPAPITDYSETKAYWERPCGYVGADKPVWLPR
jgi:crotonobetainyl-CoA:carnitine CoA-transferase CaiB-like acyl-CoA transferase